MKTHQVAVLETLSAVQTFLDEKKADIAPINESGTRKVLDDVAVQLTAQSLDQEAGQNSSIGETARQTKLRRELREHFMAPISAVVKTVLPQAPELTAYAVPSAKASTMRLIASAGVMADAAKADERCSHCRWPAAGFHRPASRRGRGVEDVARHSRATRQPFARCDRRNEAANSAGDRHLAGARLHDDPQAEVQRSFAGRMAESEANSQEDGSRSGERAVGRKVGRNIGDPDRSGHTRLAGGAEH